MGAKPRSARGAWSAAVILVCWAGLGALACSKGPSLSHTNDAEALPDLGPLTPDGPRLGALLDKTPVFSIPSKTARLLGYLHAGATVARSIKAQEASDCIDGWYAIWPKGYVCAEKNATTEMSHPTLQAMALPPRLTSELPYAYARTTKVTSVFNRVEEHGVELGGRLAKSTVLAIVGSWTAPDESNEPQLLGLRMNGQFVRAEDLEPSTGSSFVGTALDENVKLPLAFVVRRGVRLWSLDAPLPTKVDAVAYHQRLQLSGRFRTVDDEKFFATENGTWVRHQDATIVLPRHEFPDFATDGQKWLDVSLITGAVLAYEGKKAVYASVLSVGRDRLGDPKTSASTAQGTFKVLAKHITPATTASASNTPTATSKFLPGTGPTFGSGRLQICPKVGMASCLISNHQRSFTFASKLHGRAHARTSQSSRSNAAKLTLGSGGGCPESRASPANDSTCKSGYRVRPAAAALHIARSHVPLPPPERAPHRRHFPGEPKALEGSWPRTSG